MGINFSVASGADDGGGTGSDRAQQADDNIPEDHDAGPNKDPESNGSGDHDVIILGSPTRRVARCSVTPLSTGGHDAGMWVQPVVAWPLIHLGSMEEAHLVHPICSVWPG